ncbi:alpha/beta hydrolase [Umezawaea sp.]|uniref:alpha/beta fold hydrolase n=1 Tax=Umezawaea sp. TaxID=1955258 RepID=UPI002ED2BB33
MQEHDVTSEDGTRIRVWQTSSEGPTVLLCPGLGTTPETWPALLLPSAGVRALSWYHRGTMGSERPEDESRIALADHVADALAVLDDAGVESCVVLGWSMGVTVAAELALGHPDRVSGLMLVAGAPGDSFESMLGISGLPPDVRRLIGLTGTRALRAAGPLLDLVLHRLPINDVTTFLLRHSGLMLASSAPEAVAGSMRRFLRHDWSWYFTLALALGRTPRQDLAGVTCPTTVLAGRYDVLASPESMAGPAGALPQARVRVLPTSHFLPLEAPEVLSEELLLLIDRVDAVHRALYDLDPPSPLTSGSRPRA